MFLAEKKIALKKLLQKQYVFNIGHTEKKKKTEECKNNPLLYYLKIANYY